MAKNKKVIKIILWICGGVTALTLISAYPGYLLAKAAFNRYFLKWGEKLVDLEKRGLLSREYGAGWQDVLTNEAMDQQAARIVDKDEERENSEVRVVDGVTLDDYPSLSIIDRLREVRQYSNTIEIVDRFDRLLATIKTDHQRARLSEFPPTLVTALLAAEDKNFFSNSMGIEFESFVRAFLNAIKESVLNFRIVTPRGTSTITQQVAKLFISKLDEKGMRLVSKSVDRKKRELRLAVALRKMYSAEDILEVYLNHCVTSDYGMIGCKDIARGLFGKELNELTDAECVYLARMVKWGRNYKYKISRQCRIDMPRMAEMLGWGPEKSTQVLAEIESLKFLQPKTFQGGYGALVDLANEFWLMTLKRNGSDAEQLKQMDLIDPNSLIRKKGNLLIKLTIDKDLQETLEKLVNNRGYGKDTTIIDEIRIGSDSATVETKSIPRDSVRLIRILKDTVNFHEPGSTFYTRCNPGDTIIVNIRYKKIAGNKFRRSTFFYQRKPVAVNGQYYAYSIMDSRTGKLLAYYSRDRLGSRLACLLKNRTPNGSSTAKPILNTLNYDLGIFKPYSKWADTVEVNDDVAWKRNFEFKKGVKTGVIFHNSAVRGRGYPVHNYNNVFDGCKYVFDMLASSNNILAVETLLRMNRSIFNSNFEIQPDAFQLVQLLYRTGAFSRIKDSLKITYITGVRVYKEFTRIVGADVDYMNSYGRRVPISDSMYSIALGTLEMSLYEQMHLFNVFYNNDLIEHPAQHPSLVVEKIVLNGENVSINDTIRRYHPYADINNIRPSLLGMHKRLVSNRADGLSDYDIAYQVSPHDPSLTDSVFNPDAYLLTEPLSNFAKSGTTDDIMRPFNVPAYSKERTCYGLWNAVIRVDLDRFGKKSGIADIHDLTVACIGECNTRYTGPADGKSLHRFLTTSLLKTGGIKNPNGFYTQYEQYIKRMTPVTENCGGTIKPQLTDTTSILERIEYQRE
jgi:membrane peptidoglycan carboxypeptidase